MTWLAVAFVLLVLSAKYIAALAVIWALVLGVFLLMDHDLIEWSSDDHPSTSTGPR